MELIKLPMNLGIEIIKILKTKGYEPRTNKIGLLSLEFTQEELNQITELEFINPSANCLEGIEYLTNLRTLKITTEGSTSYKKNNPSINDKDIRRISNLTSLTSLTINNQSDITWVYIEKLVNLEELTITRNSQVDEIIGLDKLKNIKEFSVYGNKNLYQLEGIIDLINSNELDLLELDLLNYPEVESLRNKLLKMINCYFVEVLSGKKIISYTCGQVDLFHKKCQLVAANIKKYCPNQKSLIVGVEKYLAENITYDDEGADSKNRAYSENGKQRGKNGGTNSAYNGIMFGSCVCEGYTRAMQYLLKILGIKTENVYCISGANKIKINTNYHNMITLPDDGYHSIIRIDDVDMLYCDPCWDSCHFHSGDPTLPYCLLTKEEISKNHTLSFEEDVVSNDHLKVPREYIQNVLKGLNAIEQDKNEVTHFHK